MARRTMNNGFVAGEISPSLFGRVDLAKWRQGASTMRNYFVNYRGGAASRAGTAYVGRCKQSGSGAPPRDIPFQFSLNQGYALEFGDSYMRIKSNGAYVTEATKAISGATNASLAVLTVASHGYSPGDWVFISGMIGMTNLNGLTWIVNTAPDGNHITLTDLFGTPVNSTNFGIYVSGGTTARIYTVAAPYAAVDLPFLKYAQSADVMSLTCVNQLTLTEYAPYDLERNGATSWAFTAVTFASSIAAPTGVSAAAQSSTTVTTWYSYVVTAVDVTGQESVASSAATVENNDIGVFAGSNTVSWSAVTGATSYNIYAASPIYGAGPPSGILYGFLGTSTGLNFIDSNITADFTNVPPVHSDPFARGAPNPATGTYPGTVAYFQERRAYGYTLNNPDTYYMTQPGAFLNMDSSIPVSDSDAIIGTPWAQQVNGIQFMIPMPGGLVVLTGRGAWQLNGGASAALTPSDQTATPQAYNGCNDTVQPIVVNYDILYVQAKGSIVRDLSYNFFVNIYTGTDMTVLSNQLFTDHQIQQWAWSEEPYKVVWAIREDGVMLSLTYLKEQDVYGWSRHDTNGLWVGSCSVTEPPVDAVYLIAKRYVQGSWVYYAERMDNRDWAQAEDCWCVDAGLSYPMPMPNATLTAGAASGVTTFNASSAVFSAGNVGSIIRMGGGIATITNYNSTTSVTANITQPITETLQNDPNNMPIPAASGNWSMTAPVNVISGLNHLEGKTVAILADGGVIANQTVVLGTVTLPQAATAIVIGLPFTAQLQTLYLEPQGLQETSQSARKNVYSVTVRMESSRGMTVGTNQPDASTQPNDATVPWTGMKQFKERSANINAGSSIPLFTGDERINVPADWNTKGQVAIMQTYPLPSNVVGVITEYEIGDTSG